MQFNVAQLLKEPIGSSRRYDLEEDISELDPELAPLEPLVGNIHLMRTHSGILVSGNLSTSVQAICNRCLSPIALPVHFRLEESFRPLTEVTTGRYISPQEFEGTEEDLEDEALLINERHILDIAEIVRQNIWLALPIYPRCNWEGPGECPNLIAYQKEMQETQTSDAMAETTESEEEALDPRWAVLLNLRGQFKGEE